MKRSYERVSDFQKIQIWERLELEKKRKDCWKYMQYKTNKQTPLLYN